MDKDAIFNTSVKCTYFKPARSSPLILLTNLFQSDDGHTIYEHLAYVYPPVGGGWLRCWLLGSLERLAKFGMPVSGTSVVTICLCTDPKPVCHSLYCRLVRVSVCTVVYLF